MLRDVLRRWLGVEPPLQQTFSGNVRVTVPVGAHSRIHPVLIHMKGPYNARAEAVAVGKVHAISQGPDGMEIHVIVDSMNMEMKK